MCLKGVAASAIKNLKFFFGLQDHNKMEFLSFGESCIFPIISVSQIVLRGKQQNPLSKGIRNLTGNFFNSVLGIWQGVISNI